MRRLESLHRRLVDQGAQTVPEWGLILLLRLLAALYGFGLSLRELPFRFGLRRVFHSRLPVVSVGNLAVGGTGKTPMVDLLIRYAQQKGLRVAVISRGYAGSYSGDLGLVSLGDGLLMTAAEAGDEPCLLARRNPQVLVLVAPKRRRAIEYIERHASAGLIILDDAYQHRQVARDLNLLLLDALKPFGNRRLLPAGILRESADAVCRADLICLTGGDRETHIGSSACLEKPLVRVYSELARMAVSLNGESHPLQNFAEKKVIAFAGIARPERFFTALQACGLNPLTELSLGDHACYDSQLVSRINAAAAGADILLTTEKDAVKLSAVDFILPCFSVGLEVRISEERTLFDRLDALFEKE